MIVADTNLLAYLVLQGDHHDLARQVFVRDDIWVAPTLWQSEFRNVLGNYMRHRGMNLEQAQMLWEFAQETISGREVPVDAKSVLLLVDRFHCSAYDAEFVHAAISLSTQLVTFDQKLITTFPGIAVSAPDFLASV